MAKTERVIDPAAERALLACIYKYRGDAYVDVNDIIDVDAFGIDSNQIIYKCFQHILEDNPNKEVDIPLILSAANSLGLSDFLSKPTELAHLRGISNFPATVSNARGYAKKIKRLQIADQLVERLRQSAITLRSVTGDESINDIIGIAENPLFQFVNELNANENEPKALEEGLDEYLEYLCENQDKALGISSGFPIYDAVVGGGFRRKGISVIAARPKRGKTTVSINISFNVADKKIKVLNLDTEMDRYDHINKVMAGISKLKTLHIEKGIFNKNPNDKLKALDAALRIKGLVGHYKHISVAGRKVEEIVSIIRRWVRKDVGKTDNGGTNNCLVVLDYLKIMDMTELQSLKEHQLLGFYMTALHNLTKELDIPILLFAQTNRDGIKLTNSGVVSGSDRIVWFCSSLSFLNGKTQEEIQEIPDSGNRKLIPTDCRFGPGLENENDYIDLKFEKNISKIIENDLYSNLLKKQKGFDVENAEEAKVF